MKPNQFTFHLFVITYRPELNSSLLQFYSSGILVTPMGSCSGLLPVVHPLVCSVPSLVWDVEWTQSLATHRVCEMSSRELECHLARKSLETKEPDWDR